MKSIAITGEKGFLGTYLKNTFKKNIKINYKTLGRNYIESIRKLKNGDTLIHAASVHRNDDPEMVYKLNMQLNKNLIKSLKSNRISVHIIFLSSIQEDLNNPYGQSKKDGILIFKDYCIENNTKFISHKLPNIFGENAKPNNTSFIATFSYNIHKNINCYYNSNKVELCYVEDVVKQISELTWEKINFETKKISVKDVYLLLIDFKKKIDKGQELILNSNFEKKLYKTFISYKDYKQNKLK